MARLLRGSYPGQTAALPAVERGVGPFDAGLLLARLRIGDSVGKIVVGIVEHLHFGGAIVSIGVAPGVALGARRDAALVGAQGIDDLGDGGRVAIGGIAAIG